MEPSMIKIRQVAVDQIIAHASGEVPNECCGLLIGTPRVIEHASRARNVEASPTRYLVDPLDHFAAIRSARAEGLRVVGAYHSHTASAPVPSRTDLRNATYPDYVYLIVSVRESEVADIRAYWLRKDSFNRMALRRVP